MSRAGTIPLDWVVLDLDAGMLRGNSWADASSLPAFPGFLLEHPSGSSRFRI